MYGFMGMDTQNLAAVHLLSSAFEISAQYNVLDDPAATRTGLDGLPQPGPELPPLCLGYHAGNDELCIPMHNHAANRVVPGASQTLPPRN